MLKGTVPMGRFGSAVASLGDINNDDYEGVCVCVRACVCACVCVCACACAYACVCETFISRT